MVPILSVLMPTYNGSAFLPAALDSLAAQDHEGLEVIAVDDGSTDATVEILHSYRGRLPITVLRKSHTGSWVRGTNEALHVATGEYCSLLHQDDLWMPARARTLRAELSRAGDVALLVHPIWFIAADGRRVGRWTVPLARRTLVEPPTVGERLLVQNFMSILGTAFPRTAALELGGLDEELWYTADWDLWLRLSALGPTWHVPELLAAYRFHPQTQTATRSARLGDFREQLELVLERHLPTRRPDGRRGRSIERLARFSIDVNVGLAGRYHGAPAGLVGLLARFVALGPVGWWRYLRCSRILQRALSRVRAGRRARGERRG